MSPRAAVALPAILACAAAVSPLVAQASPTEILFVGNSFTHGRYNPVRSYNAGFGTANVHDLLCPSAGACSPAESGPQVDPSLNPPPGTLAQQLAYLQANPAAQYNEPGPYGGVPGIFLQFTRDAGLSYDVSMVAVSSATLTGYLNNKGSEAGILPLIESAKWNKVVLQDQSFRPLPNPITVNGNPVATRGNQAGFLSSVTGLVNGIDAATAKAGKPNPAVTLFETMPLANYGYTSSNPNKPIFGSSTGPAGSIYAPYVGDANPNAAMARDLHDAYEAAASAYDAAHPGKSNVDVALAGDAWITAMNQALAVRDPYLANLPPNEVDLWDSDVLDACCTTPIGYHPSVYGSYLNALVLFDQITGVDPDTLAAEFDPTNPLYLDSASYALGIAPGLARLLAMTAAETVDSGQPVPEPSTLALFFTAAMIGAVAVRRRQSRKSAAS
ncbi:MAG: PEP-CTERM sorting domain-containing protein [Acetobacteraceae bacterium]